jgi:hypothetical protein
VKDDITMNLLKNDKGIALVTSLMLTLISMTVVMALMYMITSNTKSSGQIKKYKTSLEAAYGGTEIFTKDVFPMILRNYSSPMLATVLTDAYSGVNMHVTDQNCLQAKLTKSTKNWPAGCSSTSNPKVSPDLSFTLSAKTGEPFVVYSKIVDTTEGNSDVSGTQLEGAGVAEGNSVLTPQHFPYIYRLEVQGERQSNSSAQANIEVLYAY